MDVLLIFLSISGVVFAGVMFLLASRTKRMDRESDARVEQLQSMATGSVLFAADGSVDVLELPLDDELAPAIEAEPLRSEHTARILAWDEFAETPETTEACENTDLDGIAFSDRPINSPAPPAAVQPMSPLTSPGHAYVLHVPTAAREGRVFSFTRAQRRSTT